MSDPLYLFIHLPKTGGTTINGHLARHLAWDEEVVHLGPWGDRRRDQEGRPDPTGWPAGAWERVRAVVGHGVDGSTADLVAGREARYFTVIREPAERLVSLYNFQVSRSGTDLGFWEWHERFGANRMTRRLRKALDAGSPAELRDTLRRFWFVGVTEHLHDDLPHLFAAIGVPVTWTNRRVTGAGDDLDDLDMGREMYPLRHHIEATDELLDLLRERNARDLRLYEFALELRREHRRSLGWDG
jgi:hypothetical protein